MTFLAYVGALCLLVSGLALVLAVAAYFTPSPKFRGRRDVLPPPQTVDYKNIVALENYRTLSRNGRSHGYTNGRGVRTRA